MNRPSAVSSSSTTTDALEAKLQGVESSLRQERETARRQQQLASERCRLLQQEFDSMDKTVQGLQSKLTKLQEEVSTSSPALQKLRTTVDKLTQEVNFQHGQLVQKRNKTKEAQEATVTLDRQQRNTMQHLRSVLHQRRRSSMSTNNKTMMDCYENKEPNAAAGQEKEQGQEQAKSMTDIASVNFWKAMVEQNEMDGNAGAGTLAVVGPTSLPRLVQVKAQRLDEKATRMEQSESAALQRIVTGYQKHLQLVAATNTNTGDNATGGDTTQASAPAASHDNNGLGSEAQHPSQEVDASAPAGGAVPTATSGAAME